MEENACNQEFNNKLEATLNNTNIDVNITEQISLMRMKLEQLKEKKKLLESENDNLNCKVNDLRLIIDRISQESDT